MMPALIALVAAVAGVLTLSRAASLRQSAFALPSNTTLDTCLSCSTAPTCPLDPCVTNTPGGLLLLTQFWDFAPAIGPSDAWTIHGLWPDTCNGGFDQYCDPSRNNNNIASVLRSSSSPQAADTLDAMNQFWLALNGNDGQLWSHEWNRHGTCVSTLAPSCYTQSTYVENQDIVDFFSTTVSLYEKYDIYHTLAQAGITPSTSQTYTLDQLHAATSAQWGKDAVFRCRNGALNEAWVYFHTKGRSTTADAFVLSDPLRSNNRCPQTGIRYLPK